MNLADVNKWLNILVRIFDISSLSNTRISFGMLKGNEAFLGSILVINFDISSVTIGWKEKEFIDERFRYSEKCLWVGGIFSLLCLEILMKYILNSTGIMLGSDSILPPIFRVMLFEGYIPLTRQD